MKKNIFLPIFGIILLFVFLSGQKPNLTVSSRVAAVCLWVENISETAEFYTKLLDLQEPPIKQGNRIRLRLNGSVLYILKGKPCAAESDEPFPLFALTVDDLDKAAALLKANKLRMPYGIEGSGNHRELQFYDPSGNLVELVENHS